MRLLIRTKLGNDEDFQERDFLGAVLRLGRATDQDVVVDDVAVPLSCCEFLIEDQGLQLSVLDDAVVFVNNKRSKGAVLASGDVINVGSCRLTVMDPVAGYDAVLMVLTERRGRKTVELQDNLKASLATTGVSKRKLSWLLVLGIVASCLILPALVLLEPSLREPIRTSAVLPDDSLWDSGPLHQAHRMIGDDCSACHEAPFVRVQDDTCLNCHQKMTHHADSVQFPEAGLTEARCATCHVEHNDPSVLVQRDSRGCIDCHENIEVLTAATTTLVPVSDFELAHPEFKVSLKTYDVGAAFWRTERVSLSDASLVDGSQLLFPHDVHLNPEGIEGAEARVVLSCNSCHQLESGGASYLPVTMEKDCASCHQLTFDSDFPERQLPHGEANLLVPILEEFYARRTLLGADLEAGRPAFPAERPGKETRMEAALREQALVLARRQALSTAETIFEETTCAICHEVTRSKLPDGQPSWTVLPVQLVDTWMPKSVFDHKPHVEQTCDSCHQAEQSEVATDVLMPKIESCQTCHGGEDSENKLHSECIDCHRFHNPNQSLMGQGDVSAYHFGFLEMDP